MKLPARSGRWFVVLILIVIVPLFITLPDKAVWAIAAALLVVAAWHIMFGSQRQKLTKKRKDRSFRQPPWT